MIEIGEQAPEISANAYFPDQKDIKEFDLKQYRGKWVILAFYPGDFTFVCATDLEGFMEHYDKFIKNNAVIFGVSTDSVYSHKAWTETSPRVKKSRIPLIEDFNKEISSVYGFLNTKSGAARRGLVIIDPDGNVQYISVFNDGLGKDIEHIYNSFMGLKYIHDTPAKKGHICVIPANWKPGKKALDINVVADIGKL
ncbi:MAG: peroxiredoxin [Candidatus Marsarchaeota archaeon]|nr:peroxiredoxin [Candidatus Marsarchaeota archaeon]MCL5419032.1 peroxiredoxin [Candidatus Marsarchaeota archaeon]